jgi:hypothetical protein
VSDAGSPDPAVALSTDPAHGGRWTSLRTSGPGPAREWLWRNPAVPVAHREAVQPRQPFVDAGGGEECFPSVTGDPARGHDHGDVWSRPWSGDEHESGVDVGGLGLRRRVGHERGSLRVDYSLAGPPGTGILHAVHLLLALSDDARIEITPGTDVVLQDHPAPGRTRSTRWPDGDGVDLSSLGPVDGSARSAVVATDAVDVVDGEHGLSLRWGVRGSSSAPVSLVLWRNLGGWPADAPYRSIGVEPLLGSALDRDRATPEQLAVLGTEPLRWWLEIRPRRV